MTRREFERHARVMSKAFAELPERDQMLLRLRICDGLRVPELARVYGTTRGAIYVRVHRASERLEEHFLRHLESTLNGQPEQCQSGARRLAALQLHPKRHRD